MSILPFYQCARIAGIGLLCLLTLGCVGFKRNAPAVSAEDFDPEPDTQVTQTAHQDEEERAFVAAAIQREEAAVQSPSLERELGTPAPLSMDAPREYVEIGLAEALQFGLANSEVIADVGGAMLRSSANTTTVYDPAIQEANPRTGLIGALSEFDTNFTARLFNENNDRQLNNTFLGGGTRALRQDATVVEWAFNKKTAAGTQLWLGSTVDYDSNNAPGNEFPHAFNAIIGAEIRQPLFRGAGTEFNRIAGPNSSHGNYNGVLVSRIDTDISLARFEASVRDYTSRVEDAYWELYFAYRNLDAKVRARDAALETWRRINALAQTNRSGGEAVRETQARDQLQRLEVEVQNALVGRLVEGTQTSGGTLGSAFRGTSGVHVADRRLRLLIGRPINDGALLRPADEPVLAAIEYNWNDTLRDALTRRVEIRQQKSVVKRRELEYSASKNFLKPKVDVVFQHNLRGFGRNLVDDSATGTDSGAFNQLANFDHQETQIGVDVEIPIGNRRGSTTVNHAELQLRRERAVLTRLERQITHDVSNAISNLSRAWAVAQSTLGSLEAAQQRLAATESAFELGNASLDLLLDAQRRLAAAESEFYRSLVEHSLAAKTVELKKGTLLSYNGITLAEGGWSSDAMARVKERNGFRRTLNPEGMIRQGPVISNGLVSDRQYSYAQTNGYTPTNAPTVRPLPALPADPASPPPQLLPLPDSPLPAAPPKSTRSIAPLLNLPPPPGGDTVDDKIMKLLPPPKSPG